MDETPDSVIGELQRLVGEAQRGVQALYEAELKVAELESEYDKAHAHAIIRSTGTAAERAAQATLTTIDLKLQLQIAKAEFNRVKTKLRAIESAQVATSVIAKQVELLWRHG
jgi:hypothetical protein